MALPRCVVLARSPQSEEALWLRRALSACCDFDAAVEDSATADDCGDGLIIAVARGTGMDADLALLTATRLRLPRQPILVVGTGLNRTQISRLLAAGAYDYVSVGSSEDELLARIMRGIRFLPLEEPAALAARASARVSGLVGSSPAIQRVLSRLPLLARCRSNVLIQGETGTGKELFAQAIHYLSGQDGQPWVPINCGAIPHELIEAELFGHTRGAYTSATFAREGLIAAAEGGTLFLDEIDSLALPLQSKLLRFLQEKEYRPVGSNSVRRANVRVVAASNVDLARAVSEARFRQDLYFRLNVLNVRLPPLRERREDIPELAAHFLQRFAVEFGRPVSAIAPSAIDQLCAHDWPGNVRELAHTLERGVLLCTGGTLLPADIETEHEQEDAEEESFQSAKARVIRQFERNYLSRVLSAHKGNISHAARAAKKDRRALFELIRKHGIAAEQFRG